jgi:hypothetical protein
MTFSTDSGFDASSGPSVLSLDYQSSKVNLSWDVDEITSIGSSGAIHVAANSCSISPYADLSSFLPISISFKNISNLSAIEVSKNTVMLLFNCSDSAFIRSTNFLDANSSRCQHFEHDCGYGEMNCLEFTPQHQLMLGKKMEQANCSHFQFYVTHNPSLPVQQWIPRVFELAWINTSLPWAQECSSCNAGTACGYEDDGRRFRCFKDPGMEFTDSAAYVCCMIVDLEMLFQDLYKEMKQQEKTLKEKLKKKPNLQNEETGGNAQI